MATNGKAERVPPQIVPSVLIELDRSRNLRYDMWACFDVEMLYSDKRRNGINYSFGDILRDGTALGLACLLWGGLRHEDPELSLDEVTQMFRPHEINRISVLVHRAVLNQVDILDEEKKKVEDDQKKTETMSLASGTGSDSFPSQG